MTSLYLIKKYKVTIIQENNRYEFVKEIHLDTLKKKKKTQKKQWCTCMLVCVCGRYYSNRIYPSISTC